MDIRIEVRISFPTGKKGAEERREQSSQYNLPTTCIRVTCSPNKRTEPVIRRISCEQRGQAPSITMMSRCERGAGCRCGCCHRVFFVGEARGYAVRQDAKNGIPQAKIASWSTVHIYPMIVVVIRFEDGRNNCSIVVWTTNEKPRKDINRTKKEMISNPS